MEFLNLFRRKTSSHQPEPPDKSASFVMTLDGKVYSDPTGRHTDVALAGGAKEVAGAGRMVVINGRLLQITNESYAYQPSLAQMRSLVSRFAAMGLDLSGLVVIVYDEVDNSGRGKRGTRYRCVHSGAGVELIAE
jgi:hypothetical protein